jgi:hypothetical protein
MSDTVQNSIVYILIFPDLKGDVCKIGSSENWIDRNGGYLSSFSPYNAPTLKYVIPCNDKKESIHIELILHYKFEQCNTNKNTERGWYEKIPTTSEIQTILDKFNINNEIIFGNDLELYQEDLHRTIRNVNAKDDEFLNNIFQKEEEKRNDRIKNEKKEEKRKEKNKKKKMKQKMKQKMKKNKEKIEKDQL